MDRFGLIILSLLIFSSCTKQGSTPTKIQVSSVALDTAVDVLNQNLGGLYMYGFGPNGARFGKVLNENSFNETLPNGTWSFYVVGWAGVSGVDLSGATKCASAKNIQLNGTETNLGLTITTANCGTSDFTNNVPMNNDPILNKNVFPYVFFESCKEFPQSPSNGGNTENLCEYSMDDLSIPRRKGYFSSLQVIVPSFMKTSSSTSASFSINEQLTSICLPISESHSGGVGDELIMATLNLPVGTSSMPFPFKVRGFYGNNECAIDSKGFKEFTLLNGRFEDSSSVKAVAASIIESPMSGGRIYLTATDSEVCQNQFNPLFSGFSGGNGTSGLPHLICNPLQFNLINNDLEDSYRLLSDLDFQFGINNPIEAIGDDVSESDSSNAFTGVFDGNRHKIQNVFLKHEVTDAVFSDFGLFRASHGAKFLDLRLDNMSIECRGDAFNCNKVGLLVGEASHSVFKNIFTKGHVAGSNNVGLLVGSVEAPDGRINESYLNKIQNVFAEGIIDIKCSIDECQSVGGLVGSADFLSVLDSSAKLSSHSEDVISIGGLVGSAINTQVSGSSSFGELSGKNYVGGLVGQMTKDQYDGLAFHTSQISHSFSHSFVFARYDGAMSDPFAGGLVGSSMDSGLPIIGSYYAVGKVFSNGNPKGIFGGPSAYVTMTNAVRSAPNTTCPTGDSTQECLGNASELMTSSWLNTKLGGNFVNTTSSSFQILTADDGYEYPRHKWEAQLETVLGYKIPFLERKCSEKLHYTSPDSEGQGTASNPYIICSKNQLSGSLWGNGSKYFKLMRDLDFESNIPVVGDNSDLKAKFDGNNFSFINLGMAWADPRGIWQSITSTGELKNLKIKHSYLGSNNSPNNSTLNNFGFIAATNDGLIERVTIDSSELNINGWSFSDGSNPARVVNLGGFVGVNGSSGIIRDCRSNGRLNFLDSASNDIGHADNLSVGSIAGKNLGLITQSSGRFEFENVDTDFKMDDAEDTVSLGGIVGKNEGQVSEVLAEFALDIQNVDNNGAGWSFFGGIAGVNSGIVQDTLSENFTVGFIAASTSLNQSLAGGIVGKNESTGVVKRSISFVDEVHELNSDYAAGLIGENSITEANSSFVANNFCSHGNESLKNIKNSFLGDPLTYESCIQPPFAIELSGNNLNFSNNDTILKTLTGLSVSQDQTNSSSTWLFRPQDGELELRATKYWFDDI
jgi:hypothetical protein